MSLQDEFVYTILILTSVSYTFVSLALSRPLFLLLPYSFSWFDFSSWTCASILLSPTVVKILGVLVSGNSNQFFQLFLLQLLTFDLLFVQLSSNGFAILCLPRLLHPLSPLLFLFSAYMTARPWFAFLGSKQLTFVDTSGGGLWTKTGTFFSLRSNESSHDSASVSVT